MESRFDLENSAGSSSEIVPSEGRWNRPPPANYWSVVAPWHLGIAIPILLAVLQPPYTSGRVFSIFVFGLAAYFALPHLLRSLNLLPTQADLGLFEDPDDPNVCLVTMEVSVDFKIVGHDRGVAWFEDGILYYSGHRTSFAIGGEDVMPQSGWRRFHVGDCHLPDLAIPLGVPSGLAYVHIEPVRIDIGAAGAQEYRFLKKLREFRANPPVSKGPRQWPPLTVE